MKKKKVIILSVIALAVIAAFFVYDYTFNSEHRDIASEEATIALSAKQLYSDFQNDEAAATIKYLDRVIAIEGEITAIEINDIILNDQIQTNFNAEQVPKVAEGTSLTIKGRCVGYDELLEMVKIDQATIINK
ncbi:OB-fold protein [Winogradskyella sp. R77965]|uniref:OB-fold protein n=1 Tax=Winogradskyella sp. R77965 TaxID=3093872 RepID=UPI0037DC84F5